MTKLTKSEISALTNDIRKQAKAFYDSTVKESNQILEDSFYQSDLGKKVKEMLDDEIGKTFIYQYNVNKYIGKAPAFNVSTYDIEQAIIIEQISCPDDVPQLILNVKKRLKLNY